MTFLLINNIPKAFLPLSLASLITNDKLLSSKYWMSSVKTVVVFFTISISSLWSVGDSTVWCKYWIVRYPWNFTSHNSYLDSLLSKKFCCSGPITCWNSGSHFVSHPVVEFLIQKVHLVSINAAICFDTGL